MVILKEKWKMDAFIVPLLKVIFLRKKSFLLKKLEKFFFNLFYK